MNREFTLSMFADLRSICRQPLQHVVQHRIGLGYFCRIGANDRMVSGFTLIDLMGTVGVMMILIGIAVPAFLRWLPEFELSSAARQVATDLQLARAKAVSQDRSFQLNFSTTSSSYVLQKCAPNDPTSCTNDSGNILPTGISFSASGSVQFLPQGISSGATTITLSNGSAQKRVCVNLIGRVKIQNSSCT